MTDDPPADYTEYLSGEISETGTKHDVIDALVGEIVNASKLSITANPTSMSSIIATIRMYSTKIFVRIALHVLSLMPEAAPSAAQGMLVDGDMLESSWCQKEYGELALAWFPSLPAIIQKQILDYVDAAPDRHRPGWKRRFEAREKRQPTRDEERFFDASVAREFLWPWRFALPDERREYLEKLGDPNVWRNRRFEEPIRPTSTPDLVTAPIEDVVSFLATWRPSTTEKRETATALAQDLRSAASNNASSYSTHAAQFACLPAIYARNVLQGFAYAASHNDFDWKGALALVCAVLEPSVDSTSSELEGDDPDWSWSRKAAAELLARGLRRGAEGIPFTHAQAIQALILKLNASAPRDPDNDDFEERYKAFPCFGALATARGAAIELAILFIFWLSNDPASGIGQSPREALVLLPDIAGLFDAELADRSPNGRIPRAIMGRYLTWLYYFAETWLRANVGTLFPADDLALRDATWLSHLRADSGPVIELAERLRDCFITQIERLGRDASALDDQRSDDRLAEYLVVLYIAEAISDDVFELFWGLAPLRTRRHAMWFLGIQLELPPDHLPPERRSRAFSYWDRRLAAAKIAATPEAFREEMGSISSFCLRMGIDGQWLMDQVVAMMEAGFAPGDGYNVVGRLAKISTEHPDRAAEVLEALVKNPHFDRRFCLHQNPAIRTIMQNGLATHSPVTAIRVGETINYLAALGDTGYLDLLAAAPPEIDKSS